MTITVTNTVQRPDGTPWRSGQCRIGLVGAGFVGGGVQIVDVAKPSTDVNGLASVALVPNATGEYYVWTNPTNGGAPGTQYYFQVPATGGPYTLQALLVATAVAAGIIAATPASVTAAIAAALKLSTLADGQLLAYSATLGALTPINPTGTSQLALAQNVTGTATALPTGTPGTVTAITGTAISVPASGGRPVTLHYEAVGNQTVVGTGNVFLLLYETTGTATLLAYSTAPLPNSVAAALAQFAIPSRSFPLGAVASTRTFELRAYVYGASGSPTASVLNGAATPTILRAVAG